MSKKARIEQLEKEVSELTEELKRVNNNLDSFNLSLASINNQLAGGNRCTDKLAQSIETQCKDIADTRSLVNAESNHVHNLYRQLENLGIEITRIDKRQIESDLATTNTFTQLSTRVDVLEQCVSDLQHSKVPARSELDDTIENDNK